VEGATVYLPVNVPGALLYVGDGHALQGDGELNGNALETSMDVEFTVDVIAKKRIPGPRVESATHIMAMGLGGSLDDAFRAATANMAGWLTDDYKLSPSETAQVLGTSAEYKVSACSRWRRPSSESTTNGQKTRDHRRSLEHRARPQIVKMWLPTFGLAARLCDT
jgi:acetamidase/formamidase